MRLWPVVALVASVALVVASAYATLAYVVAHFLQQGEKMFAVTVLGIVAIGLVVVLLAMVLSERL